MALFILFLWFSFCFLGSSAEFLDRKSFPPGFVFGTAGAAYQYEGGVKEGGRGPSVWDTFSHIPGKIADGSTGDVACDSYHRYKEDVKLIQDLGMDAYRFSISWSRILPQGTLEGGVSKEGVKYYHDLIDENLRRGIKPFVTLFHFDMPQALEDKYKGFLSRQIIKDFADYAELCFKEYGDKVKHWITLNEPQSVANFGYDSGKAPPGRCSKYAGNCSHGNSATEPYIVGHNSLLAHAAAVAVYRAKYQTTQKGQIGITLNGLWAKSFANTAKDMKAVKRAIDFFYGWYMSPITKGDYPGTMRRIVGSRLPRFTKEEVKQVNGSYDFIGVNYYSSSYAAHIPHKVRPARYTTDSQANLTGFNKNGVEIGPRAASTWLYIYPPGMRELLLYTKHHYNNPPIYITENGVDEVSNKTWTLQEALNDTARINYYSEHLKQVRKAISGGANVHGFFAWSLLDNFEWTMGYSVRFGLHYVDFINGTLNRYPKASVQWFKDFLRS